MGADRSALHEAAAPAGRPAHRSARLQSEPDAHGRLADTFALAGMTGGVVAEPGGGLRCGRMTLHVDRLTGWVVGRTDVTARPSCPALLHDHRRAVAARYVLDEADRLRARFDLPQGPEEVTVEQVTRALQSLRGLGQGDLAPESPGPGTPEPERVAGVLRQTGWPVEPVSESAWVLEYRWGPETYPVQVAIEPRGIRLWRALTLGAISLAPPFDSALGVYLLRVSGGVRLARPTCSPAGHIEIETLLSGSADPGLVEHALAAIVTACVRCRDGVNALTADADLARSYLAVTHAPAHM